MRLCTGVGKDFEGREAQTSVQLKCVWSRLEMCLGDKDILGGGRGGGICPHLCYGVIFSVSLRNWLHKRGGLIHMAAYIERWPYTHGCIHIDVEAHVTTHGGLMSWL